MKVLVSGATGTTGRELIRQLSAAGMSPRAMTRSSASASRLAGAGVEAVVADLAKPSTLAAAVEGVDAVYMATSAPHPQLGEYEGVLARAAVTAGVPHIVKMSSFVGTLSAAPHDFTRRHLEAEQAIQQSGAGWTFLRPNGFMQNTLAWSSDIPNGIIRVPMIDARWAIVDARDVVSVAVEALRSPETHVGQAYTVTGPESLSPREQVAAVASVLRRPLRAEEMSLQLTRQAMIHAGLPAWSAQHVCELLELYGSGLAEPVATGFQLVTGRKPCEFQRFAEDHRGAFEAVPAGLRSV